MPRLAGVRAEHVTRHPFRWVVAVMAGHWHRAATNQLHTDATLRITVIVLHSISAVSIHARDYPREPFVPALKERFDGIVHLEFASSVAGGLRRWYRRVRERNLERALLSP